MLIKILNEWWKITELWESPIPKDHLVSVLGIKPIIGSFGNTYKVVDKHLFLLGIIKYGLDVKYICNLK